MAEFGSPSPFSHPEGKIEVWVCELKYSCNQRAEALASRHCDGVLYVEACLNYGFSHELKKPALAAGPLNISSISNLTEVQRATTGRIKTLIIEAGGVLKLRVLFAFQTMTWETLMM